MVFFANSNCIHKRNVIFNKTATKLFTILTKCFFPYLNPTSCLNGKLHFLYSVRLIPKRTKLQKPNFSNTEMLNLKFTLDMPHKFI